MVDFEDKICFSQNFHSTTLLLTVIKPMDFGPNPDILLQKHLKRVFWLVIALKEFVFREHDLKMLNFTTQIFPKYTLFCQKGQSLSLFRM